MTDRDAPDPEEAKFGHLPADEDDEPLDDESLDDVPPAEAP
jgi:hypothetical protein